MTEHRTPEEQERSRTTPEAADGQTHEGTQHEQPDPDASSDGDGSWTDDPVTGVDPDEDRSVEAVVDRSV